MEVNLCDSCEPSICTFRASVKGKATPYTASHASVARRRCLATIKKLVWRALVRVNIPSIKEPAGLLRSDGKRWSHADRTGGRPASRIGRHDCGHHPGTIQPGEGGNHCIECRTVGAKKGAKYWDLARSYIFCPLACESTGSINDWGRRDIVIDQLGRSVVWGMCPFKRAWANFCVWALFLSR